MTAPVARAALAYFALVFLAGFALGAIRVLFVAPRWGELPATLLEAPIMLAVSWFACGAAIRKFGVPGRRAGLAMGAVAFVLLMTAELALSLFGFRRSPAEFLHGYATPAGLVGLASQIAYGLFPIFRSASPTPLSRP
jgi:hypothetical protein